jgi:hypothetical protein
MGAYDDLFARLKHDGFWGTVKFELKHGEVKRISERIDYLTVGDALGGIPSAQRLPHEEEPGGDHHAKDLHQDRQRLSA